MLYLDASFIVPLLRSEPTSAAIEAFMMEHKGDDFALSHWTRLEATGYAAREVRMGTIPADLARKAMRMLDDRIAKALHLWTPIAADHELAYDFVLTFETGLRPGDALHLAIAKNRRAELLTLDRGLLKAAKMLGIPASTGIRLAPR